MKYLKDNYGTYILYVIIGNILFGFVPVLQKLTFSFGGNGLLNSFYSSVIGVLLLALLAKYKNINLFPEKKVIKKILILCIGSAGTILSLWSSYSYISVGIATTLHYIYPIIIAISMSLIYKDPFTKNNVLALVLVIIGILGISTSKDVELKTLGIALALLSGFFWAFYIIYMEKSGLCEKPAILINFYTTLANIPLTLIVCIVSKQFTIYSQIWLWGIIFLVAITHRILAYGFFQIGLRRVSPFTAGILCTFEPVSALIFGFLLLKEGISKKQFIGLILILIGIFFNLFANIKPKDIKTKY